MGLVNIKWINLYLMILKSNGLTLGEIIDTADYLCSQPYLR